MNKNPNDIVFYAAKGKECVCGISSFSHRHHRGIMNEIEHIIDGNDTALLIGSDINVTIKKDRTIAMNKANKGKVIIEGKKVPIAGHCPHCGRIINDISNIK